MSAPSPPPPSLRGARRVGASFLATARTPIEREAKARRVVANRAALEAELWHQSLEFRSRPRIVHLQLSNFCNMACTMCYPDGNPPLRTMPDSLLESVAKDVLPDASILVPFQASEPLIFTWDVTRELARLFALELDLVTNVQFLDERKFLELEPYVSSIRFSIDSHLRDVYAAIRRNSKPDAVFANLPRAAQLCRERGIEAIVNVVFMTENARHVDGTVRYLADLGIPTICLLQYRYTDPAGEPSDPFKRIPHEEIGAILTRVRAAAAEKQVRIHYSFDTRRFEDHRPRDLKFRPNVKNDPWIETLRAAYPGYCTQSVDTARVDADGRVYPCCIAVDGELSLGNLHEKSFEQIWNGPESRDLRRAMLTQDLPTLCETCSFTRATVLPEQTSMEFVKWFEEREGIATSATTTTSVKSASANRVESTSFELLAPPHVERLRSPPTLRWRAPSGKFDRQVVVLAAAGVATLATRTFSVPASATEFTLPTSDWNEMKGNVAWWWTVWAIDDSAPKQSRRATTIRALIRHVDIPRVPGSTIYRTATRDYSPVA